MGDELSREQAQNGVNFDFEVKFDLEGQGQSPPKTIGILTKVFYTYGPNLVILAWTGDELSRGQTWWRTDGLTDGRTQATTIPEGQYWPRVKSVNVNMLVLLVTYLIFFAICGVVCVKLAHSSLGYREDIFITSEVFTFPIVVIFFHSCVPEVVVPSYAGSFIYILRNLGLCLLFCAVLWCVQIMKYIMVPWSYLFVCTLYYLIIIIMQTYLKAFNFYKSDGKRRNTLGCLDQYTRKVLRNSQDRETV